MDAVRGGPGGSTDGASRDVPLSRSSTHDKRKELGASFDTEFSVSHASSAETITARDLSRPTGKERLLARIVRARRTNANSSCAAETTAFNQFALMLRDMLALGHTARHARECTSDKCFCRRRTRRLDTVAT